MSVTRKGDGSAEQIAADALPSGFGGNRSVCTAIYFLLQQGEISALHRINSGELWHFHAGSALRIHAINPYGGHSLLRLGSDIAPGEQYWIVFSTGSWFGANFEMGIVDDPLARCPDHGDMVRRMTKVQWID